MTCQNGHEPCFHIIPNRYERIFQPILSIPPGYIGIIPPPKLLGITDISIYMIIYGYWYFSFPFIFIGNYRYNGRVKKFQPSKWFSDENGEK